MAEPPPVGGQTGATTEPTTKPCGTDFVGELLDAVIVDIDADVRVEQEEVDAVEFDAVDLGLGGEVEHGIEVDGRVRRRGCLCRRGRATWRCEVWESCYDYVQCS